jgi:hypothetical protein
MLMMAAQVEFLLYLFIPLPAAQCTLVSAAHAPAISGSYWRGTVLEAQSLLLIQARTRSKSSDFSSPVHQE